MFYNLPPTPNPFRYGGVENKNHKGLDGVEFWDYPVEQPFEFRSARFAYSPAWLISIPQFSYRPDQARTLDSGKTSCRKRARRAHHCGQRKYGGSS